eukprot:scpid85044/ scgid17734/ 
MFTGKLFMVESRGALGNVVESRVKKSKWPPQASPPDAGLKQSQSKWHRRPARLRTSRECVATRSALEGVLRGADVPLRDDAELPDDGWLVSGADTDVGSLDSSRAVCVLNTVLSCIRVETNC